MVGVYFFILFIVSMFQCVMTGVVETAVKTVIIGAVTLTQLNYSLFMLLAKDHYNHNKYVCKNLARKTTLY